MANPFIRKGGGTAAADPPKAVKRLSRGTRQQEALWEALTSSKADHLLSEARAGSGKSSSSREGQHRMIDRNPRAAGKIRYAVFNAQNAREFREQCPNGVDVGTIHSFAFQALVKAFGSSVEKNKSYLILDESREGRNLPRYLRKSVAMVAAAAKNRGVTLEDLDSPTCTAFLRSLAVWHDVSVYGRMAWVCETARDLLRRAAEWTELVDFDDMIWLAGLHGVTFPDCDTLFVDEAQDLNPAQHKLIPLMSKAGRVVIVGDTYQSIYGFRGADTDSMTRLYSHLAATPAGCGQYPLTVTFRCPRSHVDLARSYVPDIQAADNAADGTVSRLDYPEAIRGFAPGDMVLCPSNAPLVAAALTLIADRRPVVVRGRSIGDSLVQIVNTAGDVPTVSALSRHVETWKGRELSRLSGMDGTEDAQESVLDRAAGLQAVLCACDSPSEVIPAIQSLFDDAATSSTRPDAVVFSTIHRSKGLEADRVWLLESPMRQPKRDWEHQQQRNLRYVALTRAKQSLRFVEDVPSTQK